MSERDIFAAALEQADPVARSAYLDEVCGRDPALRARVEVLLRAHDRPDSLLDVPAFTPPDPDTAPTRAHRTPGTDPVDGPTRTHGEGTGDGPADDLSFLSPPRRADSLGRIGHYEVLEVLGRGGFGIVFRAFDDVLQRVVAVKVLAPQMAATSPARKRFLREARSAAPIQHDNVVRVHAVEEQPLPYLVMEFIAGETLQQQARPHRAAGRAGGGADRPAARRRAGRRPRRRPRPPRHQAGERPDRGRAAEGREAHRLRSGPRRRRRQPHAERGGRRHADVHGPGAGEGGHAGPPRRPVQPRQRAVRDAHRAPAVPRQRDAGAC